MVKIGDTLKNAKSDRSVVHAGIRKLEGFIGEVNTDFIVHPSYSEDGSYTVEFIKPDRRFFFSVEIDGRLTYAKARTQPKMEIDSGYIETKQEAIDVIQSLTK